MERSCNEISDVFDYCMLCFATNVWSQTRYFLFSSEVPACSAQFFRVVNVFGIVHSVQNLETDPFGFQFSRADKTESISMVYEGTLPDLFELGNPVAVHGKFDKNIFLRHQLLFNFLPSTYHNPHLMNCVRTA